MPTCGRYDSVRLGDYYLTNNVWNDDLAEAGQQCLDEPAGGAWSWRWRWGENPGGAPVSYPALVYGDKPWDEEPSTTHFLPRPLDQLRQLAVTYGYSLSARGRRNVSFNLWLIDGAAAGKAAIRVEVMLWLEWSGDLQPCGRMVEHGDDYELWEGQRNEGANDWFCYSFRLTGAKGQGRIDLRSWLERLCAMRPVSASLCLADVEFGTEIWDGRGQMKLRHYVISAA